jgi:hypothetical protein
MANEFDTAFDTSWAAEQSVYGGEVVTCGSESATVVVLEFSRRPVIAATGGRSNKVGGQLLMAKADWDRMSMGKLALTVVFRGIQFRLEREATSPDLSSVTLNVIPI